MRVPSLWPALIGLLVLTGGEALPQTQPIEMAFTEESGFSQGPGHFLFDYLRAAEIIGDASGLPIVWSAMPIPRMFKILESGRDDFCIGGAGMTTERQLMGQFTHIFIHDRMIGVMTLKTNAPRLNGIASFADLVHQDGGNFLGYMGFNYGDKIGPLLTQLKERISYEPRTTQQMMAMLKSRRADFGLVSFAYLRNYLELRPEGAEFMVTSYPDMHRDFAMAFLCGKAVPREVVERLNVAIEKERPKLRQLFPDAVDPLPVEAAASH